MPTPKSNRLGAESAQLSNKDPDGAELCVKVGLRKTVQMCNGGGVGGSAPHPQPQELRVHRQNSRASLGAS